nr:hypothetical protein [Tanacetum cinerariifolium]
FANHAAVLPTTLTEPTSFSVANNSPEWRQAMKEDYDALIKNGTWSLVPYASNTNVVGCIDFHETFSSVVKSATIQAVLSLAVTNNWPPQQLDVQNAIVHGNLKDKVYMKQPPSFIDPHRPNHGTIGNIICQLGLAFALKDLEPLNYFLGIEIVPHVSDILLYQKKYILKLLPRVGLSNCTLVFSLMVTSSSLSLDDNTAFSNPVKYQQGGFAIYLGANLISWTARKRRAVSRSSTQAEYKALADTVVELTWLQALLHELVSVHLQLLYYGVTILV